MNDQDLKNCDIIKKLVGKHFSLYNESFNRFSRSLENPYMVNPIKEIFKDSDDYRVSFDIDKVYLESYDDAWAEFKKLFPSFVNDYGLSYPDFLNNKVTKNKNKIKLKKAIFSYYFNENEMTNTDEFVRNFDDKRFLNRVAASVYHKSWEVSIEDSYNRRFIRFISEKEGTDFFKKQLEKNIMETLEYIGTMKVSSKQDLKVVLSRNFADWFMASTAEDSWSSCLSLESDYENAYWTGLPGTIVDPNRILIYITDGKKKSFNGIEVDRFIQRSWVVVDGIGDFHNLKWYDSKKINNKVIKKVTGIPLRLNSGEEFMSMESFEPLWFENDTSCFIYHDNSSFSVSHGDNEVYIEGRDDSDACLITKHGRRLFEPSWDVEDGLDYGLRTLIEEGISIQEAANGNGGIYCEECGDRVDEDEVRHYNDEYYCEDCFHELFATCDECNEVYAKDAGDIFCDEEGEWFCNNCLDNHVMIDGLWHHIESVYKLYDKSGEYNDYGTSVNYNYVEKRPDEEKHVLVTENNIYFPREMCIYLPTTNEWWTKKMIYDYNDKEQLKLGIVA